jgi:hypothetical protein
MERYKVFSPEWFSRLMGSFHRCCDELGERMPNFSFTAQYVITDSPAGTVHYVEEITDGRMTYIGIGLASAPDVTITMTHADYKLLVDELKGSHELATVRYEGNLEKVAPAVGVRATAEYRGHKERTRDFSLWP